MKHTRLWLTSAALVIISFMTAFGCHAQQLPIDSDLRYGTLPNGMTYYIRHNAQPQGKAEFWLAHKVGSVLEEDNERGLAHFLEHLAFNGTTHFDSYDMVQYLTGYGITFGKDINASTGFDQTLYHISQVPTARQALLDSVLYIMNDLAGELTLPEAAIDKERLIIEEEWRSKSDYSMRMYETVLPKLMGNDCRYATRIPIGSMDVVRNAHHDDLARFYHHWYRPELQAIIAIGDFDAEHVEQEIKRLFSTRQKSDLPIPQNPPVNNKPGLTYASYCDAEAPATSVYLFMPHASTPAAQRSTMQALRQQTVKTVTTGMINMRLNEASLNPLCPMQGATCRDGKYLIASSCDAFSLAGVAKSDSIQSTLNMLLTEVRRIQEHGFTQSELERARKATKAQFDNYLKEYDKRSSADYVEEYIDHFFNGNYIPGVVAECQLVQQTLDGITLDDVNDYIARVINLNDMAVLITAPLDKQKLVPSENEVAANLQQAKTAHTTAYADDNLSDEKLLAQEPTPGRIVSEQFDETTGITTMKLSNGASVQLKPTTAQNDEILFSATRHGGQWDYDGNYSAQLRMIDAVIENSALGQWNQVALQKRLAATPLSIIYTMNDHTDDMIGTCRPADINELLQLNYLYFTDVRPDNDAYQAFIGSTRSQLQSMASQPEMILADSIANTLYCGHPLYRQLTLADIDTVTYDSILRLYRQRMASAADFTFSLVGSFSIDEMRPLIERYIASLPSTGKPQKKHKHKGPVYATGDRDCVFFTPMGTPKGSVYVCMMGEEEYSLCNRIMMDMLGQVLEVASTTYMREELNGTYGVEVNGAVSPTEKKWMINANFDTRPEYTQTMVTALAQVVDMIMSQGASDRLVEKIKEQMLQQHDTDLLTNAYWLRTLQNRAQGYDTHTKWTETLKSITPDDFNRFIAKLNPTARIRVIQQGY